MNFISRKLKKIAKFINWVVKFSWSLLIRQWENHKFYQSFVKKKSEFHQWITLKKSQDFVNQSVINAGQRKLGYYYLCTFACNSNADYKTVTNVYLALCWMFEIIATDFMCVQIYRYFTFPSLNNFLIFNVLVFQLVC